MANTQNLEDLMWKDPFYHAGLTKLENLRSFQEDPYFRTGIIAPNPELNINKALLKGDTEGYEGYGFLGNPLSYIKDLNDPTATTASTITHEGIHRVLDPSLTDVGKGVLEGLGTEAMSALGPDVGFAHDEFMTNYLSHLIHGEDEPFYPGIYNQYDDYVNYATMMRPGQGPIGEKGLMKILAKKGKPFLKKTALRAHRNIEAEAAQKAARPKQTDVSPARPHGDGRNFQPQRPDKPGGFTDPGKGSYGPWKAKGGIIDKPLPGRSRYL
jgi:hypothetical protein